MENKFYKKDEEIRARMDKASKEFDDYLNAITDPIFISIKDRYTKAKDDMFNHWGVQR